MGRNSFVHLHVHTEYSLLDGAARIKKLVQRAAELEMPALAITDHGNMFGVIEFYKRAKEAGIKPILGCEVYVAPRGMEDRTPHIDDSPYHLLLLAENMEGYQNLMQLVSLGYTRGFYYKPRVDKKTLAQFSRGLIAASACLAGEVAVNILKDQPKEALRVAQEYQDIFGPKNFFLELQYHGYEEQKKVNAELINIHRQTGIPLLATNDIHYLTREDAEVQDILLCIQTGRTLEDEDRLKFSSQEFYLKDGKEMALVFGEFPDALANTLEIAERCSVEFTFGQHYLPHYNVPPGHTLDSYLRELCYRGLKERYQEITPEIEARLEYELKVIADMGFSGYFLIVWDFVNFARQKNILVGPGRGSAAGSLVAYVLGITNIDPLKYGLLFERFLNPERVSMPDIDIDFCFERREEVIDYVIHRYGEDRVAQIITFGTMAARAAIRDVGRVMNLSYGEVDKIAKMVPQELGMTIEKALEVSSELKQAYQEDPRVKKLIDTAAAIEGMPRHASTHAAGVVIARDPLTHYLPLYKTSDGVITTQFAKETVEEIGLLKMDLLGLRTLTVIGNAVEMIRKNRGISLNIDTIPLDDPKTYEMLSRGESIGVFQLESSGMRTLLRELRPGVFEDLIALVALYRPGPLGSGMVDDFIKSKHGEKEITYLHPRLEPILKDTYGVILYQEQVMRIASELAGFTLGQADMLRRAMGKKKPEIIASLRNQFIEGAAKNGIDSAIAGQIFDLMEYFAGYGFNKSHSAAYALVSYQTAYLKANFPLEYMASLLTSVSGNADKVALYIEECRRMGITILPPDINESDIDFTVVGDKIRFGLAGIKNVGQGAIEAILENRRKEGPFRSLQEFACRVDHRVVNKRVMESLIKGGAFDSLGVFRSRMLSVLDRVLEAGMKKQKDRENGQLSLFDLSGNGHSWEIEEIPLPDLPEFPTRELLAQEKEMLGLYISGHPLAEHKELLQRQITAWTIDLPEMPDGSQIRVGGLVAGLKKVTTRKGETMGVVQLEDLSGTVEVLFFPKVYQQYAHKLKPDAILLVSGRLSNQEEEVKVLADEAIFLEEVPTYELYIKIDPESRSRMMELRELLLQHKGDTPVYLYLAQEKKMILTDRNFWVELSPELEQRIQELLGPFTVWTRARAGS